MPEVKAAFGILRALPLSYNPGFPGSAGIEPATSSLQGKYRTPTHRAPTIQLSTPPEIKNGVRQKPTDRIVGPSEGTARQRTGKVHIQLLCPPRSRVSAVRLKTLFEVTANFAPGGRNCARATLAVSRHHRNPKPVAGPGVEPGKPAV